MGLVPAKCTNCGGKIKVDDAKEAGICEHCGLAFITEKVIKNNVTNYNITNNVTKIINGKETDEAEEKFNKGLVFLGTKAYDKAEKCFEEAINISPSVSKYYFYSLVAKVKNFTDYWNIEYFFVYKERYAESFFKFTTPEECKALSKEFDIDLNNGYDGLVLDIYKKYWGKADSLGYYLENEIKKVKEDSKAYDYLTDLAKQKLSEIAKKRFYNGHFIISKHDTENIKKWLEIIIKAGKCPDKSITSLENIDLAYMYRLAADITKTEEEIKSEREKEQKEQEEIQKEMPLIEKCAKLERKLYHHEIKEIPTVISMAVILGLLGWGFGSFNRYVMGWHEQRGVFITIAVFIVVGTFWPLLGCILKIKQDKLIAQVKNKVKLENELEKARREEASFINSWNSSSSSSYSSSSYSSSSNTSSSSSSSSSDTSSSSPSSYDICDINGNKTGSVENKGSGRINNVYDENGVVKGWAVDNGGDTMDYYNSDGSYGGTIDKD